MRNYRRPVSRSAVVHKASAKGSGFSGFARGFESAFGSATFPQKNLPHKLEGLKHN